MIDQILKRMIDRPAVVSNSHEPIGTGLAGISNAEGIPRTCPSCSSTSLWLDVYGGGPHCVTCHPWPSRSLVACEIGSEVDAGTRLAGRRGRESPGEPGGTTGTGWPADITYPVVVDLAHEEEKLDAEFFQKWKTYEYEERKTRERRIVIERRDFRWL